MGILDGKVAVVTGAARGIGRAIAEKLASEGADLALCDLDKEWLKETADSVSAMGRRVECFAVDVSNADGCKETIGAISSSFGQIDIMINNAGIIKDTMMRRMKEADWDAVIAVNLKGTFLFTQAASGIMIKQRSGAIINIASIIGLIGNVGQCNYAASKAGVIAMTKSVAKELAGRNVRVNAVAPGFIESKMTQSLSEDIRDRMLDAIPMKRFGEPEDIAKVVLFLASDESSYITGQVLTVSGGMVM